MHTQVWYIAKEDSKSNGTISVGRDNTPRGKEALGRLV